jgi:Fur family transcriptional regulator, ferric uptake regulator
MGRPTKVNDEEVRRRIRGAGLRCTAARVAVLRHLETAPGPRTHAEVSESLDSLGFDRATIYRNLTELTEAKLLARVELGDHVWRFEATGSGGGHHDDDHPHFVCTTCGEVSCLDDIQVEIQPRPAASKAGRSERQGIGSVTEILLKGHCEQCQEP